MQKIILTLHLQLCRPEDYAEIETLIRETLNEDVHYSTKPTDLRNQRVYAIRVSYYPLDSTCKLTYARPASMASSTLPAKHTRRSTTTSSRWSSNSTVKPWPKSPTQLTHNLTSPRQPRTFHRPEIRHHSPILPACLRARPRE